MPFPNLSPDAAPSPVILGVDPGLTGAIAVYDPAAHKILDLVDYPRAAEGIDLPTLKELLLPWAPLATKAIVEHVHAMPKQGVVSTFTFGRSFGQVEGVLAGLNVGMIHVRAAAWKRIMGVTKDKQTSVNLAAKHWPDRAHEFTGPRGGLKDGRAEACLLALIGARAHGPIGVVGKITGAESLGVMAWSQTT